MSLVSLILLAACVHPTPPPTGLAGPVDAREAGLPPVSFAPLEERVNVLVAEAQEADRRDRLIAARELMQAMRNKDPASQHKVYEYLDEILRIEERDRPAPIGIEGIPAPVEEEVVPDRPLPSMETPAPIVDEAKAAASARAALSDARYLDAVDALAGLVSPEAAALRKEAVDGYCRVERERAGHLFLEARALAPGGERIASLRAVRTRLTAINERFPDNAYAAAIADNVAKVDADLLAAGVKP